MLDQNNFWSDFCKTITLMIRQMNRTMNTEVVETFDNDNMLLIIKGKYFEASYDFGYMKNGDMINIQGSGMNIIFLPTIKETIGKNIAETPLHNEMTLIFSLNHSYQITMTDYITQHLTTLSGAQYNLGNGGTSVLMNIDIGES